MAQRLRCVHAGLSAFVLIVSSFRACDKRSVIPPSDRVRVQANRTLYGSVNTCMDEWTHEHMVRTHEHMVMIDRVLWSDLANPCRGTIIPNLTGVQTFSACPRAVLRRPLRLNTQLRLLYVIASNLRRSSCSPNFTLEVMSCLARSSRSSA